MQIPSMRKVVPIVCKGFGTPPFKINPPFSNISPFLKIIEPPILRGNFVVTGRQEMEFFELDPSRWLKSLLDMYLVSNLVLWKT